MEKIKDSLCDRRYLFTRSKVLRTSRQSGGDFLLRSPRYKSGYPCLINLVTSNAEDCFLSHFFPLLLLSNYSHHLTTLEVLVQTPELNFSLILLRPEVFRQ
jgi:hypothetical protein